MKSLFVGCRVTSCILALLLSTFAAAQSGNADKGKSLVSLNLSDHCVLIGNNFLSNDSFNSPSTDVFQFSVEQVQGTFNIEGLSFGVGNVANPVGFVLISGEVNISIDGGVPLDAVHGDFAIVRMSVHNRIGQLVAEEDALIEAKAPGAFSHLAWGIHPWFENGWAPGTYMSPDFGRVKNFQWEGAWVSELVGWEDPDGKMVRAEDGSAVYGVNHAGELFEIKQLEGALTQTVIDAPVRIVPGSVVWSNHSDSANFSAPGLFAVGIDGRVINYMHVNGQWETRSTAWGGEAVAGSLVAAEDGRTVYGVRLDGSICQIREEDGVLVYWVISAPNPIVPGSLVWSNDSWTGDFTAPGLYGVDSQNRVTNFRWIDGDWDIRTTLWGSAIPGSLTHTPDGNSIFGVDLDNKAFEVRQELGELVQWSLGDTQVAYDSLVAHRMWTGDNTAPGIYGVDLSGKVVNFQWNNGWTVRSTWGRLHSHSLISGDSGRTIYGINREGKACLIRQENGELVNWTMED